MDEKDVVVNETESAETVEVATDEASTEESQVETQEVQENIAEPEEESPFPKKAVNAISRRDKKIGKLSAELEQLRAQLQQVASKESVKEQPQGVAPQKGDNPPNPDDYQTWDEYLEAKVDYNVKSALEKKTSQEKQSEASRQQQEYFQQRIENFGKSADLYAEKISDFEVIGNRVEKDVLPNLSADVHMAIC